MSINSPSQTNDIIDSTEIMYLLLKRFDIDCSSARTYKSFDTFDESLPFESYEFRQDLLSVVDFKRGDNDYDKTLLHLL